MKDDRSNYVIVGVFVIAMVAGLVLWIALLSGRTGATDTYYVRYRNVMGLSDGTQVYFEGHPVGLIESIERAGDAGERHFEVELSIRRGWRIPDDSVAQITASGLLSAVVIDIREGASRTYVEPGGRIPSEEAANVMSALSSAAGRIDEILDQSLRPLVDSIGEATPEIVENLGTFTADLNQAIRQINELLSPANTTRVRRILENLEATSDRVATLTAGLGETRRQLDHVIVTLDGIVSEHEDELAHSLIDVHHSLEAIARHIDEISSNLEATTRNMNEFSLQIRQNPGVLIRGRDAGDGAAQ